MNSFDPARVEADISTLNDAFTYDPPERWFAAYQRLEQVRAYLDDAQHAFRWVFTVGIVVFLTAVGTFLFLPSMIESSIWVLCAVMVTAPDAAFDLARSLAERREPLLKAHDRIKDQLQKFHDRAHAPNDTKHHVSD